MKTVIFNFFYTPTALSDYGKFPANLPDDIAIITKNQKESQMKPTKALRGVWRCVFLRAALGNIYKSRIISRIIL